MTCVNMMRLASITELAVNKTQQQLNKSQARWRLAAVKCATSWRYIRCSGREHRAGACFSTLARQYLQALTVRKPRAKRVPLTQHSSKAHRDCSSASTKVARASVASLAAIQGILPSRLSAAGGRAPWYLLVPASSGPPLQRLNLVETLN